MSVYVNSNTAYDNVPAQSGLKKIESKIDKSSLKFANLVELAAENPLNDKIIEINGEKYNLSEIPIAEGEPQRFTSTGDPEQDRKLAAKYDYFDSCTDYTNAGDYAEMTASEDFSGMSTEEIYKAIYEKYRHCYGENFLEAG